MTQEELREKLLIEVNNIVLDVKANGFEPSNHMRHTLRLNEIINTHVKEEKKELLDTISTEVKREVPEVTEGGRYYNRALRDTQEFITRLRAGIEEEK